MKWESALKEAEINKIRYFLDYWKLKWESALEEAEINKIRYFLDYVWNDKKKTSVTRFSVTRLV